MRYDQEQQLVDEFVSSISERSEKLWGPLQITTEFNYVRGKTDVVALTTGKKVIAFEMKLKKWKEALHQAYRNTCFAHYSYIVVPEEVAFSAIRCEDEFRKRSVGICYVSDGQIVIALKASQCRPLQKWLTERAEESIMKRDEDEQLH